MTESKPFGWRTDKVLVWMLGDLSSTRTFGIMLGFGLLAALVIGTLIATQFPAWATTLVLAFDMIVLGWLIAILVVRRRPWSKKS